MHWAEDPEEAHRILREIVARHGVKRVVKAKSMLTEELGVNPLLESLGVEVYETDLGEYLIQLLGEPPSHIVGPAIHLALPDIQRLFHQRFGTPLDASPEALAAVARKVLREAFLTADLGISGANFLVAETGTLALMENEGNIRLSTSLPRVHVAFVGIEKLLPRFADLALFLPLTARAATGQRLSTYVSLIQGPAKEGEEGPKEVHVVLVDHGRTSLLHDPEAWEVLRCLRCGACLNACPVYRQTGGAPLRLRLLGAHRGGSGPRAPGPRGHLPPSLRLHPLRSLLRSLPGEDPHPQASPYLAAESGGAGPRPHVGKRCHAGLFQGDAKPKPLPAFLQGPKGPPPAPGPPSPS